MSTFQHGVVEVGTEPTLICVAAPGRDSLHLQNVGDAPVFIGGPDVAASGDRLGFALDGSVRLPAAEDDAIGIYGVVAKGSASVVFLV